MSAFGRAMMTESNSVASFGTFDLCRVKGRACHGSAASALSVIRMACLCCRFRAADFGLRRVAIVIRIAWFL